MGDLERFEQLEETRAIDCVEIYLPKNLDYLSELYGFLRQLVTDRGGTALILEGFSIYEVDGFFRGIEGKHYQERSLVIRIMLFRPGTTDDLLLRGQVRDLGREIATRIAVKEEQIWICDFSQRVTIFRPDIGSVQ